MSINLTFLPSCRHDCQSATNTAFGRYMLCGTDEEPTTAIGMLDSNDRANLVVGAQGLVGLSKPEGSLQPMECFVAFVREYIQGPYDLVLYNVCMSFRRGSIICYLNEHPSHE